MLTSLRERKRWAKPEQFLMTCKCTGDTLDVKKTWAVLYIGLTFQSSSKRCTLLSVGVMKYTPEIDSRGSLFFSMFSTTAAAAALND